MLDFICQICESPIRISGSEGTCKCNASISVESIHGHSVAIFKRQELGKNEFSIINAAEIHDNAMQWLHDVHGTNEVQFREHLVGFIGKSSKDPLNILITSAGAGNDIKYILDAFPNCFLYVQDIAYEMIVAAIERNELSISRERVKFFVGDACALPFIKDTFDVVYHFGGINLFDNIELGLHEMHRVAKVGGIVQFGDEGIAPWLYNHEISNVLIQNNDLYKCEAPLKFMPLDISDFNLKYLFNNCFYLVRYIKSSGPKINLDVIHKGARGGSLRTRYYGVLEGINPNLKEKINVTARKLGISRVDYLERIIMQALDK